MEIIFCAFMAICVVCVLAANLVPALKNWKQDLTKVGGCLFCGGLIDLMLYRIIVNAAVSPLEIGCIIGGVGIIVLILAPDLAREKASK